MKQNLCPIKNKKEFELTKSLPTMRETWIRSLGWEDPWRRKWQPTPVFLPGKSHRWRSLVGYSPWGRKESDMTERLFFFFSMEKEMATHSSILAWRIPGTEEPGGLQSMGSQRVGHDRAASLSLLFCCSMLTPVFGVVNV